MNQSAINQLVEALRCLPGVGPKTAQRMVMHLLERDRDGARHLAARLQDAMDKVNHCQACRNFTELDLCDICSSGRRESSLLCIVENPGDVTAIEQTGHYFGKYFVLMGCLSPIDGIGPNDLGLDQLISRCETGVEEVILAIGSSVEGETTSHYITELLKQTQLQVSKIAQGIPIGSELEYVDGSTLSHALSGRKAISVRSSHRGEDL